MRLSKIEEPSFDKNIKFSKQLDFLTLLKGLEENFERVNIICQDVEESFIHLKNLFECRIAAGGLVSDQKGNLLFIFRNSVWDLPKGHTEDGESLYETAIREVQEETGVLADNNGYKLCVTYHYYFFNGLPVLKESHWFALSSLADQKLIPQQNEGISQVEWVSKEKLPDVLKNTWQNIEIVLACANF